MKSITYHWHQLDPTAGGYMSAHVGEGDSFQVFTTPISLHSQAEHRRLIYEKILGEMKDQVEEGSFMKELAIISSLIDQIGRDNCAATRGAVKIRLGTMVQRLIKDNR